MPRKPRLVYSRAKTAGDLKAYGEILYQSFNFPEKIVPRWIKRVGKENVRVVRLAREVPSGLAFLRMGQWFGGRSVPMVGIAAVGTRPEHRAIGAATALMQSAVKELHKEGVALSALYPATQTVYRRAGYEQAGFRVTYEAEPRHIGVRDRKVKIRATKDTRLIKEIYTEQARATAGMLDRTPLMWKRIFEPWQGKPQVYVVGDEGYVVCRQADGPPGRHMDLNVIDFAARTPAAARRILTLFADHTSLVDRVRWTGSPTDYLQLHIDQQVVKVSNFDRWMLRIVHLKKALEARGYPRGLQAEIHLKVDDDLLPANRGKLVLRVSEGKGTVKKGGRGSVKLNILQIAAIYTGYATPAHDALRAAFAGPPPWIAEMF